MNPKFTPALLNLTFLTLLALAIPGWAADATNKTDTGAPGYESRQQHDPNGIGKFYMGREIAHVMGHQAADWLERPQRQQEERTDKILAALRLEAGMVVADVGAGSGYLTFRIAPRVAPNGKVLAVDIQPEMLALIRQRARQRGLANVDARGHLIRRGVDDAHCGGAVAACVRSG